MIDLPPGYDLNAAKAYYQNGFLHVDVPLLASANPRSFSVPIE
jgi:HSP20 family molecular chaperone IbpA